MTYQLTGDTSKLADHVGHEVKVKGSESSASASAGVGNGTGQSDSSKALEVSSVKMVSKTCKSGAGNGGGMSH